MSKTRMIGSAWIAALAVVILSSAALAQGNRGATLRVDPHGRRFHQANAPILVPGERQVPFAFVVGRSSIGYAPREMHPHFVQQVVGAVRRARSRSSRLERPAPAANVRCDPRSSARANVEGNG